MLTIWYSISALPSEKAVGIDKYVYRFIGLLWYSTMLRALANCKQTVSLFWNFIAKSDKQTKNKKIRTKTVNNFMFSMPNIDDNIFLHFCFVLSHFKDPLRCVWLDRSKSIGIYWQHRLRAHFDKRHRVNKGIDFPVSDYIIYRKKTHSDWIALLQLAHPPALFLFLFRKETYFILKFYLSNW